MTKDDFPKFSVVWIEVNRLFNREISDVSLKMVFNVLKIYELKEVTDAVYAHIRQSKFAPTIADIVTAIDEMHGRDKASLNAKANDFYNAISHNFSMGNDYVCEDRRAVYAFKRIFGSLRRFGEMPLKSDVFERKRFVDFYCEIKEEWLGNTPDDYLLEGIYHNENYAVSVRTIGNAERCTLIAEKAYETKPYLLEQPRQNTKQLTIKTTAGQDNDMTTANDISKEQKLNLISEFVKALSGKE